MTITVSEDMTTDPAPPNVCSVDDCGKPVKARGLCFSHYQRQRRRGTTAPARMKNKGKACSVPGCENGAKSLGMCEMHYARQRLHGDVGDAASQVGLPVYDRAMRMVDASAGPDACHPWTGALINELPAVYDGGRKDRTTRSARRVIAHHAGLLTDVDDPAEWVRMRPTCDPLCCNVKHMDATVVGRPGTRKDA